MRPTHRPSICAVAAIILLLPLAASAAEPAEPSDAPVAEPSETNSILEGTWRPMAPSPFGSARAAGFWDGDAITVADIATARVARYDPGADDWTELEPVGNPGYAWNGPWTWTGSELVIVDRASGRAQAFDPEAQTWRRLARAPLDGASEAIAADGHIVVTRHDDRTETLQTAVFEIATDTWRMLPDVPNVIWHFRLLLTGDEVVTSTTDGVDGRAVVLRLGPDAGAWDRSSPAPAGRAHAAPVWTGRELVFADDSGTGSEYEYDAIYDLSTDTWTAQDYDCPVEGDQSVWFDDLLFQPRDHRPATEHAVRPGFAAVRPGFALDPASRTCYALADDPVLIDYLGMGLDIWPARWPGLTIEADGELIFWSGWSGSRDGLDLLRSEAIPSTDREGIIFTPATRE